MNTSLAISVPETTTFDSSRLLSLVQNRNTRFHLDLSESTMIQVLQSCATFHQRMNPRYNNNAIISLFQRLEDYIGETIMPIDITDEFYVEVQEYLLTVPNEKGKIVKPSTISTYFSVIQGTLSWASKHRCPISETYNCWRVDNYEKPKVALSISQIAFIYSYDLTNKLNRQVIKSLLHNYCIRNFSFTIMQKVKDQFVLECQIGQRYSDACRLSSSNFNESGTVYKCVQQKTGNKATVNLSENALDSSIAFALLKKYDYKAPCTGIEINLVNKYLHLLCRAIGGDFNKDITGENKIKGEIRMETYKMYELITTHTARRTFITHWANSNNKDMNIVKLQKCTGHKDVRQISRYTISKD